MKKRVKIFISLLIVVAFIVTIGIGCKTTTTTTIAAAETTKAAETTTTAAVTTTEETTKTLKVGYVCKLLTHPYFQAQQWGMEKRGKELGVDLVFIDANLKDELCLQAVDNLIAQNVDGIIICVTNQGLGAAVSKKCKEAGVALLAISDTINDENGDPIPYVGIDAYQCGAIGGKPLGELAIKKGFLASGNVVKVMNIDVETVSSIHDRIIGYNDALKKACPELKDSDFITQSSKDGMFEDSLRVASSILNAHPEATHWLVTGINDDGALAAIKIFKEAGFDMNNVLACGMGGWELSIEAFKNGEKNYITTDLFGNVMGEMAINVIYNFLSNGTPMPANSYQEGRVITIDNWKEFYPNGKLPNLQ